MQNKLTFASKEFSEVIIAFKINWQEFINYKFLNNFFENNTMLYN